MTADPTPDRVLVAVFASPVAEVLLRWAPELGYRTALLDPAADRPAGAVAGFAELDDRLDLALADVVVTDHHRPELGEVLRDALARPVRWVGVMGNPRHEGPHVAALAALGVPPEEVARVHRPIGLDIGSRAPAEIALSTLAGLLADRNGRAGGTAHGTGR
ncbi:XdhC family protein [Blastococcus sp. SYSU D00820]